MAETKETLTQPIKDRLRAYTSLLREIECQKERLARHVETMGAPSSPNLTGMPSAPGYTGDKLLREVAKKIDLEEQIAQLEAEEEAERTAIEKLIRKVKNPEERAVLRMRYLDREDWPDIAYALFHKAKDWRGNYRNYQRKIFRIHGAALVSLAEASDGAGI